jgi:hypothetical protein
MGIQYDTTNYGFLALGNNLGGGTIQTWIASKQGFCKVVLGG